MVVKYDINEPVLMSLDVKKISDNSSIDIELYEKRKRKFYDVILNLPDKKIFIGRFIKEFDNISVDYNNGKVLIYIEKFIRQISTMKITKVLTLYDIVDDTCYSVTELEALSIFNKNIDSNYLEKKDNYIYRTDIEKSKRLLKSN